MKKIIKSIALVLALIMILQIMPMTAKAEGQASGGSNTLYVFDLETFLDTLPSSKVRYDYLKLATALQGLVNRDTPQLYFYFLDGDEAKKVGWDIDEYWLGELTEDNAYLADYTQVVVSDYWSLFTTFAGYYNGIVLWDEDVPATANVASTIAGVENLLPVRYATGADDLYTVMLTKGFAESDIKKNLVGMFTGTGTIPGSETASTGSAKNDAYIWAKEQYLDTGKTNPLLMTYSIDGSSWNFEDEGGGLRNAKFISAAIPTTMQPNEIVPISVTVENTGTETWSKSSYYRLGLTTYGTFGFYTDAEGTSGVTSNRDRLSISSDVAPGEQYTFAGYLKAPEAVGSYEVSMEMILDGVEWFGKKYVPTIRVVEDNGSTEEESLVETPVTCDPVEDKSGFNAMIISAAIPDTMAPGEIVKVKFTVKNTGTESLYCNPNGSYGQKIGLNYGSVFALCTAADGTSTDSGSKNRIKIKTATASGETYTIECYIQAPDTVGTHTLQLQAVDEGDGTRVGYFGSLFEKSITVSDNSLVETQVSCDPVEDKSGFNAMIISAAIPDTMAPGEIVKVKFTVKNTGTESLYCNPNGSAGQKIGLNYGSVFALCTAADGTSTDSGSKNRIKIKTATASGETYPIECYIKAPDTTGTYTLQLQAVDEGTSTGVGYFGSLYQKNITVTDALPETPISGAGIVYDNLFNTALPNADYYIANKAFFWDLSPDDSIAPIDDRTQPVGTDVATLKQILLSQAKQAEAAAQNGNGTGFYTVGGFVPWTLKYTAFADPQSSMAEVTAEWTMVELISTYHGQTDADAYGTVGLSNASVFCHVPLNNQLKQNNDKGESSAVTYKEDTAYIMFFMGDWDGASWVNGILPFIWQESQEDAAAHPDDPIPLAWPINACLADRIPQMYNMLYSTAGATDYFVTGDNGTGYLNPMFLEGSYVPEGLENYLDEWVAHNIAANEKFDLDITGFLIEGTLNNTSGSTETVRQAYSQMTPYGVVSMNRYDNIVNGDVTTPFPGMTSLPNMRTEAQRQQAATQIAGNIKFDGQFFAYRSVKASRANIRETLNLLEAQNPGIKYEVVDPYTFMELYAQYGNSNSTNTGAVYEADKTATPITIDGAVGTGEWDGLETMVVSKSSEQISNHGYVWGSFADDDDLTATYQLTWDSENLYMLEKRVDNYLKPAYTVGANPLYDIDATMLFLDLDGVRDGTKFFTGDFAIHYSFDADGNPVVYLRTGTDTGSKNHTLLSEGDVQIARTVTSDGYICEIAIPWSLLSNESFSFTPESGNQVGMTILAIDHDELTSGGRQIMWHGNGDTQDNWGVLKFVASDTPALEGYTAAIASTTTDVRVGDTVRVTVNVNNAGQNSFSSCEVKISYDNLRLTYNEEASVLNGATVKCADGTLVLEDYGEEQAFGTAYELVFTAVEKGEIEVKLESAAFSDQANAVKEDLTPATLTADTVQITISKVYNVQLPDIYTGETSVEEGANYTFSVKDGENYNYGVPTATVGGESAVVVDNGDGSYTISNIIGDVVITGSRTPKSYQVTFAGNAGTEVADGAATATYGTDYVFTLPSAEHYSYTVTSIKANTTGNAVAYTKDALGVVTIAGSQIKDDMTITIDKVRTDSSVTVIGTGASDAEGYAPYATPGSDYSLTINMDSRYDYTVTATVNGDSVGLTTQENVFTIAGADVVIGEIVFTVDKSIKMDSVSVAAYLTLDENQMWLVKVETDKLDDGVYTYCGNDMFWSDKYNAYCYLVIAEQMPVLTASDLAIGEGTAIEVAYSMDVNMSGKVDANDAQLVYNMYNAMYSAFTEQVTMEKFLCADVNGDAVINVNDATAIINMLLA